MPRIRLRSGLITAALVIFATVTWLYFAPTTIGGSTRYVVTSGISMEPRFHSGDLAIVRPTDHYYVGEIAAYHSDLLHVTVLHRIIAIRNGRYVFKGDNNSFIDPVRPTRAELLGTLWLHVPHGGLVLKAIHSPVVAGGLCALLGFLLLVGAKDNRRRRRRRRKNAAGSRPSGIPIVKTPRTHDVPRPFNFGALLTASAAVAAVFAALGLFALIRRGDQASPKITPYSQQVAFGYRAHVTPGPVYPGSVIKSGDPIFLTLVHQLAIHISYRVTGPQPNTVKGVEEVVLKLTGPNGWSRNYVLTPPTHFTGNHTSTDVSLDLPQVQSLLNKIESLTDAGTGGLTFAVGPQVRITGNVAGHPIKTGFAPVLTFEPQGGQLVVTSGTAPTGAVTSSTSSQVDYTPSLGGTVSSPGTAPATVTVLGVSPEVDVLRWIALLGLLLSVPLAVYAFLRKRGEPFEESVQIQAQYGHLIVPVLAGEDLGWPPVDVPNIKALVRLAESGQRLILHNRSGDVDTYMVNDEGTVYRYQVKASKIVWGEWTDDPVPVEVAASGPQAGTNVAPGAANAA